LRLALCVAGTAACGLVYWLGRELVSGEAGLAAAALAAVSPVFIGFSTLILSETLFAATLVASLIPLARLFRRHMAGGATEDASVRGAGLAVVAGLLIGAACYVRPSWLLAAPLYAGLLVLVSGWKRRAIVHGALIVAATVLSLLPWGIRNQRVTGHFVLTTLWSGPSLYDGLHPGATGESDMTFFDRDNLLSKMSEYDVNKHYSNDAWRFVRENPGRAFDLALIKLGRFWKPWPSAPQFEQGWAKGVVAAWFVALMVLSLIGIARLRDNWPALIICVSPILYFSALHMVFVSSLRYRLPAEYPLLVPAAAGLLACVEWQQSRGRPASGKIPGRG
jgi:4-amino-4-deoxy-L-arabinose transferase-like glycosyltransferase